MAVQVAAGTDPSSAAAGEAPTTNGQLQHADAAQVPESPLARTSVCRRLSTDHPCFSAASSEPPGAGSIMCRIE